MSLGWNMTVAQAHTGEVKMNKLVDPCAGSCSCMVGETRYKGGMISFLIATV